MGCFKIKVVLPDAVNTTTKNTKIIFFSFLSHGVSMFSRRLWYFLLYAPLPLIAYSLFHILFWNTLMFSIHSYFNRETTKLCMFLKINSIYSWWYIIKPLWLLPTFGLCCRGRRDIPDVTSQLFWHFFCFEKRYQVTVMYVRWQSGTCFFCRAWDLENLINSWIFNESNIRKEVPFIFFCTS